MDEIFKALNARADALVVRKVNKRAKPELVGLHIQITLKQRKKLKKLVADKKISIADWIRHKIDEE